MYYIRLGNIPVSGKSGIYFRSKKVGEEDGLSVYDAVMMADGWHIILPHPVSETCIKTLKTISKRVLDNDEPCYLLSGVYIGTGTDGEPLIEDFKILKEIDILE